MAYRSSSSNANSKVHTCSTECEQSYAQLKKLYDTQREQLGDASIEIQAYTQALKKVEAQLVTHQKNQLCQLSANNKAGFGHNGAKESKVSETITSVSKDETSNSKTRNDKVEMPKIKIVRMSEPIIEEWESDSEDDKIMVKPKPKAEVNSVKALASWVWKHEELDHVFKSNNASKTLTIYDYVDALGRFKSVLA
ncbi:hypothetical protein Tco_0040298 [Tanacetum coccineum]